MLYRRKLKPLSAKTISSVSSGKVPNNLNPSIVTHSHPWNRLNDVSHVDSLKPGIGFFFLYTYRYMRESKTIFKRNPPCRQQYSNTTKDKINNVKNNI